MAATVRSRVISTSTLAPAAPTDEDVSTVTFNGGEGEEGDASETQASEQPSEPRTTRRGRRPAAQAAGTPTLAQMASPELLEAFGLLELVSRLTGKSKDDVVALMERVTVNYRSWG